MLWSGIFFQEIFVVHDPEYLHKAQIQQSATLHHHFLS